MQSNIFCRNVLNKLNFKSLGKNVKIDIDVLIPNPHNIIIGDNVRIDKGSVLSCPKYGEIIINNNVHIAPYNLIYCGNNKKIIFENHSGLAAGCKLYGRTENYDGKFLMNPTHNNEDVELIEDNIILEKYATLGCNSTLFPGCTIPIGTVFGSHSLYTGKYALKEWSIYAGNPLKYFRERSKNCEILSVKYK